MPGVDFTDKFFEHTLQKLSANNSLFFTSRQLYYFFNERRHSRKVDPLKIIAGLAMAASIPLSVIMAANSFPLLAVLILLLVIPFSIALLVSPNLRQKLRGIKPIPLTATPQQVESWYRRWHKINGDISKLLPPLLPAAKKSNANAIAIDRELKQYSFDRAVICDNAEIARCLIANNFHFENNSAVLSVDGYPQDIFETVMEMLRLNPELQVYAVHDASRRGVALPHILSTEPRWFAGTTVKIFDVGLLPRQIFSRPVVVEKEKLHVSQTIPQAILATLQPEEVSWLAASNIVSLESFPPQTILRIVTRGIAKSRDPQADDALVPVGAEGDPAVYYYYGAESFG